MVYCFESCKLIICMPTTPVQTDVNKTCTFLQTTAGKDEPNIVLCGNRNRHNNTEIRT